MNMATLGFDERTACDIFNLPLDVLVPEKPARHPQTLSEIRIAMDNKVNATVAGPEGMKRPGKATPYPRPEVLRSLHSPIVAVFRELAAPNLKVPIGDKLHSPAVSGSVLWNIAMKRLLK